MAKQYPIYPKGGNGFGVVGGEASGTSLADVDLPAAEIGGGWFHGFGVWYLVGVNEMVFLRKVLKSAAFCIKRLLWDNLRGFGYFMSTYRLTLGEVW